MVGDCDYYGFSDFFPLDEINYSIFVLVFFQSWDVGKFASEADDTRWLQQTDTYFFFQITQNGSRAKPLTLRLVCDRLEIVEEELLCGCLALFAARELTRLGCARCPLRLEPCDGLGLLLEGRFVGSVERADD